MCNFLEDTCTIVSDGNYTGLSDLLSLFLGKGVISTKDISAGEYILFYSGTYLEHDPGNEDDDYVFEVIANAKKYWLVLVWIVNFPSEILTELI